MTTKSTPVFRELGSLKLTTLLVALLLLTTSCDNGLMNSDKDSDSMTTIDMMTTASKKGAPANCDNQVNNTEKKLLDCVTLDGVRAHQEAFQNIADANDGNRSALFPGYQASVDYVSDQLMMAGYDVTIQDFSYETYYETGPSSFSQIAPVATTYIQEVDFSVMTYSADGELTAPVTGVDLALAAPATSTSGCEPTDFIGFPAGHIALIQRGACTFAQKATFAANAGAVAAIVFNQGTPGRIGIYGGTLGSDYGAGIPVLEAPFDLGVTLASSSAILSMDINTFTGEVTTSNILADLPGKNEDNVVMAGAVLDSPATTPGINNNGSGASALLETALKMSKVKPQNSVRFAWWADNFTQLRGTENYISTLSSDEFDKIALYLNFDVIASPNYVLFVYDGDNSDGVNSGGTPPIPDGTDVIENIFDAYYASVNEPTKAYDLWFVSASRLFLFNGVPSGGIYTGSAEIKTPDEEAVWGGVAGEPYDQCAFLACDTIDNVSLEALEINSDAVAYSVLNAAMNTNLINGTKAKGNFKHKSDAATE